MKTPEELRAAASRYRQLAQDVTDEWVISALLELTAEYERLAVQGERTDGRRNNVADDRR